MDERWYTVHEIAAHLQVDEQTVRRWLKDGTLRGRAFGGKTGWRIPEGALQAFLALDPPGKVRGAAA